MLAIPLLVLSAILGTGAVASELDKPDDTIRIRTINRSDVQSSMQWEAVELLSEAALRETGALLDLDLARWATACRTGLYTVFILTDKSDGLGRAIAVIARKDGDTWVVDQAFGRSSSVAPTDLVTLASAICAKMGAAAAPYTAVDLAETDTGAPVRIPAQVPAATVPALPAPAPDFEEVEPTDDTSSVLLDDEVSTDDGTSSLLFDEETSLNEPASNQTDGNLLYGPAEDEDRLDFGPDEGAAPDDEEGAGTLPM
jgi:hypothetical protein